MRQLTFGFLNLNTLFTAVSPLSVIASAKAGGFNSAGLRVAGRRPEDAFPPLVGNSRAASEVRKAAEDAGVRISSVTGYGFFPDVTLDHHVRILDAAAELGSDLVIMNVYFTDHSAFADQLGVFAEAAAARNIRPGLEFMPFSGLRSIDQTKDVLERSGAANAGYIMDALHLTRSGGTIADVRAVDPARIFLGQLCDVTEIGSHRSDEQLMQEARSHRLYPGEGDLDLFGFIDVLPVGIELEIEAPRSDLGGMNAAEAAAKARKILLEFMEDYEAQHAPAARE